MTLKEKMVHLYSLISHVDKNGDNTSQRYKYVKAADVVHLVRKAASDLGLYLEINMDFTGPAYTIARAKEPNAPFTAVNVRCSVTVQDRDSDQKMTASGVGSGADSGDKAAYKAQTGALKYALRNLALIPDEADPEADESIDEDTRPYRPVQNSNLKDSSDIAVDFKDAARGNPAPAHRAADKFERPSENPIQQKTAAFPKAEIPQSTDQPSASDASNSSGLPTEEQMNDFRARFSRLGDELSTEGKLKSSRNLPINRKILAYLLAKVNAKDPQNITVAQWDQFFAHATKIRSGQGIKALADLIEETVTK